MSKSLKGGLEIIIDDEKCIKCGKCVLAFPDNFYFDKDFKVNINSKNIDNIVNDAIRLCPKGAILKK